MATATRNIPAGLVLVKTESYQWSHGKKPSGYGHWYFYATNFDDQGFWFTGLYSEAKRAAIKWAQASGHNSITTGS